MNARLYSDDILVKDLNDIPDCAGVIHKGIYYTLLMVSKQTNNRIFIKEKDQSNHSRTRYWNVGIDDWSEELSRVKPGYTLSIERAQELLAEQDKKIIELTEDNHRLKDIADSAMKANDEIITSRSATIKKLTEENKRLNSSLTSWMKEHSVIGLENVRLENALHEIAESATRAAKSKANHIDFSDTAKAMEDWSGKQETINREMNELAKQTIIPDDEKDFPNGIDPDKGLELTGKIHLPFTTEERKGFMGW